MYFNKCNKSDILYKENYTRSFMQQLYLFPAYGVLDTSALLNCFVMN